MKDYSAIEKKLNALMEELKILKEADDVEVEETEKEEETAIEEVPAEEVEEVSEKEVEEIKDEEPTEEVKEDNIFVIDTFAKSILSGLMQNVDDLNLVLENSEDSKYNGIFEDVKEILNKAIGSLQAVLADDSEDAEQQDEAREEAEEKIDDAESEETEEIKVEDKELGLENSKVELIQPLGDNESDDISDEEVEEVEEKEEKTEESLKEDLEIVIGLDKFTPWAGAVDTFDYILSEYGYDAMERVLEDLFPDGCTDVELNDLFRFDDEIYNLFGVKDPYAEDEEDDEEEVEEDDDIEIEESASHKVRHR